MADVRDPRRAGERIESLLEEVRSMCSPPTWARVEELVQQVVALYGGGLARMVELLQQADSLDDVESRFTRDELVSSLLLLHGLHPQSLAERVQAALDRVRPYLGSHGGDVELLGATAETVRLRMAGSCDGCPSSAATVKLALEGAIRAAAPEVTDIQVEGVVAPPRRDGLIPVESLVRKTNGAAPKSAGWFTVEGQPLPGAGELTALEVEGERLVMCRTATGLFAYRDGCPSCGSRMDRGALAGDVLACPRCGERYDVHLAGRSLASAQRCLQPVPLLEHEGSVRVALA
jgi:Fe-S cluster biogenesis protein NfuA/nitrite reductase/ring-hydroxylating ferredoxin subunit